MSNNRIISTNDINIFNYIKKIWFSKLLIFKITLFSFFTGIIYSIYSVNSYTASTIFIPQINESNSGVNLGGLASLAGINIGNNSSNGEINPTLYPKILNSAEIKRNILETEIEFENKTISYKDYLLEKTTSKTSLIYKYTFGLPKIIYNKIKGSEMPENDSEVLNNKLIVISKEENNLFKLLNDKINLVVDNQEGYIELSVLSEDPKIAAIIASKATEALQSQIIQHKIQRAKEFLNFTQKQYNIKQKEYFNLLDEVAKSKDQNKNITSNIFLNKIKEKEGSLLIVQSVYQELAKQLEQAKLQVVKNTPIFSIIKPVSIPIEKTSPNRKFILIIWTFGGLFSSIIFVLIKDSILKFWKELNEI